jgi:hypothetical protein
MMIFENNRRKKIIKSLIKFLKQLQIFDISPEEAMTEKCFSTEPFDKPSKNFKKRCTIFHESC